MFAESNLTKLSFINRLTQIAFDNDTPARFKNAVAREFPHVEAYIKYNKARTSVEHGYVVSYVHGLVTFW